MAESHNFSLEARIWNAFEKTGLSVVIYERTAPNWIRLTVNGCNKTTSEVVGWPCGRAVCRLMFAM